MGVERSETGVAALFRGLKPRGDRLYDLLETARACIKIILRIKPVPSINKDTNDRRSALASGTNITPVSDLSTPI
jgi:hypothetical protein